MEHIQSVLSFLSGILFLAGFFPYIKEIWQGKTHPSTTTWIVWTIMDLVLLYGMYTKGSLNGQVIGATCGAGTVMILSFFYGETNWTKMDVFCFIGLVIGIVMWFILQDPILAIINTCVVGGIGATTTIRSAWNNPKSESKLAWSIWEVSCVLALLAIPKWSIEDALPPITFFLIETTILLIILLKNRDNDFKEGGNVS